MTQSGVVFNIQRFSTHDGPGIRTTVFLKGCPLSCQWCANPESISGSPQLMVRDVKCAGCSACIDACPEKAIHLNTEQKRHINWDTCTQCFKCVDVCLYGALTVIGETKTPESIVEVVEKDRVFYKNSGGGVTISGGEPLLQHEFLKQTLEQLKQNDFHITLDTTGFTSQTVLDKILPLVDLVLLDIKHLDPDCHRTFTGVDNTNILENARHISSSVKTWFRIPLIQDVNDSQDNISQIVDLAKNLGVEKISLLPFHEGGTSKWRQLGMQQPDFTGNSPEEEYIDSLVKIITEKGIMAGIRS
ncbi:MAG: glycyl-radical enzyme activating protein [Deltaproteobacteria bacterium]|nr:glycyl-radical enzyme activating protein [Deltaproteobacteria bacterium]